jgi:hypothetical protein
MIRCYTLAYPRTTDCNWRFRLAVCCGWRGAQVEDHNPPTLVQIVEFLEVASNFMEVLLACAPLDRLRVRILLN